MIPDRVASLIDAIRDDRGHGAGELARQAVEALQRLSVDASPEQFHEQLEEAADRLTRAQPEMTPIRRIVEAARLTGNAENLGDLCRELIAGIAKRQEQAARHAAELIREGTLLLTHSYSGTVEQALRMAHDRGARFRVLATESLPLGEGRALVRSLGEYGIEAVLIPDTAIYREMAAVSSVFAGADSVTPEGIVNKVGTSLVALAARERRKRMYIVSTSDKLSNSVPLLGPLYDLTPLDLLTGIITEEGRLAPAALRGRFERRPIGEPRFVLDVHLGRLAALLRMLGFDCLYANHVDDAELVRISNDEDRILLTRDVALLERNAASRGYFVVGTQPRRQLEEVVGHLRILPVARPFTRCLRCNAVLREASLDEASNRVPPLVSGTKTEFTRCPNCGKVYWHGTHYQRMLEWIERLRST